ncbi:MAG: NADPH-dependent 7-cyano-7-deazaguanine reductase QueF [Halioglobus sp.]|nr:NADPH-dependent 7-cyano-7-deazaguanine reductase QueF [Halioglobus sp.]
MLLGRHTPVVQEYAPQLLYAIPRSTARTGLGIGDQLPFHGVDLWHAYEMSWLDDVGKPVAWVGRFHVPADSPNIVESKSFKLYLNSLNSTRFPSIDAARGTIVADIEAVAGARVALELLPVGDASLAGARLSGECLDRLTVSPWAGEPTAQQLQVQSGSTVEEILYSHLLRSLCPVTGQPDWATVWLHYRGTAIERSSLLQYIIAYREHQEFHEQCVERMFCDISSRCEPEFLHLQAFYTRRGGLDINPFRSTDASACPQGRLDRQ